MFFSALLALDCLRETESAGEGGTTMSLSGLETVEDFARLI